MPVIKHQYFYQFEWEVFVMILLQLWSQPTSPVQTNQMVIGRRQQRRQKGYQATSKLGETFISLFFFSFPSLFLSFLFIYFSQKFPFLHIFKTFSLISFLLSYLFFPLFFPVYITAFSSLLLYFIVFPIKYLFMLYFPFSFALCCLVLSLNISVI